MDCLEGMKHINDKSIDMILCDLPYGKTQNKWDKLIPFESLWEQYERIIKDNGAIVLTADQPFTSLLVNSNQKLFRYSLVWEKTTPTGFLNANKMPLRIHEDILVFYKSAPQYNPQKTVGHIRKVSTAWNRRGCKKTDNYSEHGLTSYDSTERYPTSILKFATDKQKSSLHPTQKPLSLFQYLIETYTKPGDVILDNCMGSGTTAEACMNTDRKFIGFENDAEIFSIAENRISQANYNLFSLSGRG